MQLGRLGPDEAATQRVAGHGIVWTGTTDFEAPEIVAAQEESVDDLLLDALVPEIAGTRGQRDAPVGVAGKAVQWNEILAVDIVADELRVAAEPGNIGAQRHEISGMRIDLAVAMVQRDGLAHL